MSKLVYRLHEWCAERISGVQFPRQLLITKRPDPPFFRYAVPWPLKFPLVLLGLAMILAGIFVLFLSVLVLYSLV